jgi:GTP-binding protein HflX
LSSIICFNQLHIIDLGIIKDTIDDFIRRNFMIYGNIDGIRNSILNSLESIHDIKVDKDVLVSLDIVNIICDISTKIDREISVAIDRKGRVTSVAIGDSSTVEVPLINIKEKKLSGIRVIHTHPNGNSKLSALDISALLKLKLDCIVALGVVEGTCKDFSLGLCKIEENILVSEVVENLALENITTFDFKDKVTFLEKSILINDIIEDNSEKAIIVGTDTEESLDELEELANACNVDVAYKVFQRRSKIDSAYYIGSGKAEEISMLCQALRANIVIFDDELSGSHVRNLEQILGVKVIDRTTLILEIFARRAKTREAKIQVELAQLKYRLPRLMGLGTVLSRTGAGIGTRGPGEKKLETDRRHIRENIYDLQEELSKVRKVRETQREKRNKDNIPKISLVGYTNAGKSTLRNKLCDMLPVKENAVKEKVFVADMLFATLDITTRAIVLPDNRVATLTDTVGFIRKLPHDLVEAFKSTLEEVVFADLLVHVVDGSSPYSIEQINAVEEVLKELNAHNIPLILAINKVDRAEKEQVEAIKTYLLEESTNNYNNIVEISAVEEINIDLLLAEFTELLPYKLVEIECIIPYSDQSIVAFIHRNGNVLEEDYREEGTYLKAQVDAEVLNKTKQYKI